MRIPQIFKVVDRKRYIHTFYIAGFYNTQTQTTFVKVQRNNRNEWIMLNQAQLVEHDLTFVPYKSHATALAALKTYTEGEPSWHAN